MDNPLRLNNFAMGLRELSRIVLHDLAPDADIEACYWYKEEKNKDGAVVFTRQQRIKYAVQAGLPEDFVENTLLVDVEETINEFRDLVNTLSKFTHVGPTGTAMRDHKNSLITSWETSSSWASAKSRKGLRRCATSNRRSALGTRTHGKPNQRFMREWTDAIAN